MKSFAKVSDVNYSYGIPKLKLYKLIKINKYTLEKLNDY